MKKLRSRVILMLIIINQISTFLSGLMLTPLVPELFGDAQSWTIDLMKIGLQSLMTLVFFTLFVVLGVREITAPVLSLAKASGQIAQGNYDVQLPQTKRKDEIGQLQNSFAIMVKELKSTEHMQKDFASNVSHEYKTPLSVIGGYTKLLRDGNLPQAERELYCNFILEETERLSQMTSTVLLLTKLENLGIQPASAPFALDEQLRQAALLYWPQCEAKNIALDVNLPDVTVAGNAELLMHVWTNLLDNAVKFSPDGGLIKISMQADEKEVSVCIEDNGIGMDGEAKTHIFDKFYQGDVSRKGGGNGLGLALAMRVVQLHHGHIDVQSEIGIGSTFIVMLPV